MSHKKIRKEANCLNCGKQVQGIYCSHCGQENREPYETVWGLLTHFIADILHWDGKFWKTMKALFLAPGALSKAYVSGKRASYVLPVRLYLICSLIFGISLSYALSNIKDSEEKIVSINKQIDSLNTVNNEDALLEINLNEKKSEQSSNKFNDSLASLNLTFPLMDKDGEFIQQNIGWRDSGRIELPFGLSLANIDSVIGIRKKIKGSNYTFGDKCADYVLKYLVKQKAKNTNGKVDLVKSIREEFKHTLPKSFFILMPLFALMLWLMYNKKFYFFYHHMVFTIHYYCVSFVVYSLAIILNVKISFLEYVGSYSVLAMIIYLYLAMLRFYGQGKIKTFIKFSILGFITFLMLALTFLTIVFLGLLHA